MTTFVELVERMADELLVVYGEAVAAGVITDDEFDVLFGALAETASVLIDFMDGP